MASDKFGNNPVAPLYNATGRNPRDLEMGSIGKPLGSVGNSGGGGKDFGTPGKAAQLSPLGQGSRLSPFNFYGPNSLYDLPDNIRNKNRTGGGGSGGGGQIVFLIDMKIVETIIADNTITIKVIFIVFINLLG